MGKCITLEVVFDNWLTLPLTVCTLPFFFFQIN